MTEEAKRGTKSAEKHRLHSKKNMDKTRWALWNQILNIARKETGKPLVPADDNPYRREEGWTWEKRE